MKCVTMIYPNKQDAKFDFEYYLHRHIPWARKLVPDSGIEIRKGLYTLDGQPVSFICLCRFWISSEEDYRAAMQEHGKELIADVSNFTNVKPMVQIDELLMASAVSVAA